MFTRVEQKLAGPSALGILIPHGPRTLVIVRPRALTWDLLPARWNGDAAQPPSFCTFTRDEAAGVARRFVIDLEKAVEQGINPLESFGNAAGTYCQLWLRAAELVWIGCRRFEGKSYLPMVFASKDEVESAANEIAPYVWPRPDATQEYYINTQRFG
jgi:hypothetical protein